MSLRSILVFWPVSSTVAGLLLFWLLARHSLLRGRIGALGLILNPLINTVSHRASSFRHRWRQIFQCVNYEWLEAILSLFALSKMIQLFQDAEWIPTWIPVKTEYSENAREMVAQTNQFWGSIMHPALGGFFLAVAVICMWVGIYADITKLRIVGNYMTGFFWLYSGSMLFFNAGSSGIGPMILAFCTSHLLFCLDRRLARDRVMLHEFQIFADRFVIEETMQSLKNA